MYPVARNLGHCLRTGQTATDNSLCLSCSDFTTTLSSEFFLYSCFPFLFHFQFFLNSFNPILCVHNPSLLSTSRAFLSWVTLTSFPAFPHPLRILSYRDADSCVYLIASRFFFFRAKLGGKQALITVTRLKHAQHAHQLMNPSHSNPCPLHCATRNCDWRSWGSLLKSNFNCVTTKPSF